MSRLLGLTRAFGERAESPREVTRTIPTSESIGESGWLIRFFDSAFFCEWIAVSYLYKHDHPGVRDYLCNRMYTLPLSGIESYLFQICYMLIHKPSPSLDKFVIDICSRSLKIALKVHWFLMAELEDVDDNEGISRIQEKCQFAATLMGEWPPLIKPLTRSSGFMSSSSNIYTTNISPIGKNPVLNRLLSSKQKLLSLTSSPPSSTSPLRSFTFSPSSGNTISQDDDGKVLGSPESNKLFKKFIPGTKVRDALLFRKSVEKEDDEPDKEGGFFKKLLRDSRDEDARKSGDKNKEFDEESEKEGGFFKRLLRDSREDDARKSVAKENEKEPEKESGFFKRLLRDGRDAEMRKSVDKSKNEEEHEKEAGFFKRLLSSSRDEDAKQSVDKDEDESEKDGFFRRILSGKDEEEVSTSSDGFFKRLFRESKSDAEEKTLSRPLEDDEREGLFKKLFKDKFEERKDGSDKYDDLDRASKSCDDLDKEGFFKKLFEENFEDKKDLEWKDEDRKGHANGEDEEQSEFSLFRRSPRVHPEDSKASTENTNCNNSNVHESSPGTENFFRKLFKDRDRSVEDSELYGSRKNKVNSPGSPKQQNEKSNAKPPLPNSASQFRKGTYHESLDFVQTLCETSYGLVDIFPVEDRKSALRESLVEINAHIDGAQNSGGICFPIGRGMYRVVHIPEDEAVLLNSREKAPYLICVEVLKSETPSNSKDASNSQKLSRGGIPLANGDALLPKPPPWAYPLQTGQDMYHTGYDRMSRSTSEAIDQAMAQLWEAKVKFVHVNFSVEKQLNHAEPATANANWTSEAADCACKAEDDCGSEWVRVVLSAEPGISMDDIVDQDPPRRKKHRRVPSTVAIEEVKAAALKGEAPPGLPLKGAGQDSSDAQPKAANGGVPKVSDALAGELWEVKKERICHASLYGKLPGWDLRSVIVKSGDDCRQEHLAVQLISHFYDIFQEAGLPLWLRPYEVLVTSSYTALIETIPDTASLHSIKSRFPNISSLRDFFVAKYEENSPSFKLSQRNFVESMAGYSLVCYLLQVKDRHNGNLLLDEEGHIIHIDFGFMLSNSPGGVNFESAPFKLTRELLEVMDSDAEGVPSEFFDYFKVLCIQGFLTCRKHAERIILLVEMLQDSDYPCFKGGPRTIQNLRKRFHLSLTEEQCVSLVLSLISSSLDAWRTRQYDYYQRVLNGIL
ncbi:phosphatidylinositol 4-kinase beta 1-like isoform X1 [Salvia splendens]|uniref:phosphatidylinositol 4-kinase beta 1-like isoform X1 n=1 Tax=Salvia splendens TaxID=180675 RepID=UPI001C27B989|nr:phosphatidylinositol 4-kinase beta 1-like isoform X1 [Salvia splendens]